MTQQQHGHGLVPLRPFVPARLDEAARQDSAVVAAHRSIVVAWHASRSPIYREGPEAAVKALAGTSAEHTDQYPTWGL